MDEPPVWNLTEGQWQAALQCAATNADVLEDGAYVRAVSSSEFPTDASELQFFATVLNKPANWHYPFLETVPQSHRPGAFVGRAWHEAATGFVQFEVLISAAAEALRANYESGVDDLDYVTYEQAVEQAVRGTPSDLAWLHREFGRLVKLAGV